MNENILENYLYEHIPISASLGVRVKQASLETVILGAPILNNINHKKTVFGGSLHAVSTLACWSLLYINLKDSYPTSEIVITQSAIDYLMPITTDFEVRCIKPSDVSWTYFKKVFEKKSKARIQLSANILVKEKTAVQYQGTFAVLKDAN